MPKAAKQVRYDTRFLPPQSRRLGLLPAAEAFVLGIKRAHWAAELEVRGWANAPSSLLRVQFSLRAVLGRLRYMTAKRRMRHCDNRPEMSPLNERRVALSGAEVGRGTATERNKGRSGVPFSQRAARLAYSNN